MFYSKSTNGFYTKDIHGDTIPADAVSITPTEYKALLEGQVAGKQISAGADGRPTLVDRQDTRTYAQKRAAEYPNMLEYIDGVVKGDQAQIQRYIDACLAVKAKYPK